MAQGAIGRNRLRPVFALYRLKKCGRPAAISMLENGTVYVVVAAAENRWNKLWVESAYIDKKDGFTQVLNAEALSSKSSETPLASRPSSNTTVPQDTDGVKGSIRKNMPENTDTQESRSTEPKTAEQITEDKRAVGRLSVLLNRKVEWYKSDNRLDHGYYENGVIYLNENSKRNFRITLAHEFIHSLQGSKREDREMHHIANLCRKAMEDVNKHPSKMQGQANAQHSVGRQNEDIADYTEKMYNERGWVSINNVIGIRARAAFFSKLGEKQAKTKFTKTPSGEYIIPVGEEDGINNILVYTKGSFNNPIISKIVKIHLYNETELAVVRSDFLDYEQKNIGSPIEIIESYAGQGLFSEYALRDYKTYRELKGKGQGHRGDESFRNRIEYRFGDGSDGENIGVEAGLDDKSAFSVADSDIDDTILEHSLGDAQDDIRELIRKYGQIEPGVAPVRDVAVPKKTSLSPFSYPL